MWAKIDPENYLPQLKETDREALQLVKRRFGHYITPELIHYTYKHFPYYALNSTVAADVLTKEEVAAVENERPRCVSAVLFTIGYEGKTLEQYLNTLIRYGVEVLCDVRKNPVSMKYGFSKAQLQYACSGLGIKYLHMPDLGIESDKRQQLNNQADYDRLFLQYRQIVLHENVGVYYAKRPGGEEYQVLFSTNLATETYMEWDEITEDQYNGY